MDADALFAVKRNETFLLVSFLFNSNLSIIIIIAVPVELVRRKKVRRKLIIDSIGFTRPIWDHLASLWWGQEGPEQAGSPSHL